MAVNKSKYVVLDIETNGLTVSDDILSISLYRPDNQAIFNRFLPLELSRRLKPSASAVNGITMDDLKGAAPLSQQDIDNLFAEFELDQRIILTYSDFDKRMLKHYFLRKGLCGFEKLNFYNFKRDVISSKYSEGNVTKDNLCAIYGIGNVRKKHSSLNDCILEWQLFEKMDGKKLLITNNKVFEMSSDYIIPISYFSSHPNLARHVPNFPYIKIETQLIQRFELDGTGINRFETNANGILIEHLLNRMLHVHELDSRPLLLANKSKLRYLGTLPSKSYEIPLILKEDGTVTEVNLQDKVKVKRFNNMLLRIKSQLVPVTDFISKKIFFDQPIMSQELVIHKEDNILALCDLSTADAVLEIKTGYKADAFMYRNQLYYEAAGRKCFLLQVDWSLLPEIFAIDISQISFSIDNSPRKSGRQLSMNTVLSKIDNEQIDVVKYTGQKDKVTLRCKVCGHEWQVSFYTATHKPKCPTCEPIIRCEPKVKSNPEECIHLREQKYYSNLHRKSNASIIAKDYTGSRNAVTAECLKCGHAWTARADHLLDRPYCPKCRRQAGVLSNNPKDCKNGLSNDRTERVFRSVNYAVDLFKKSNKCIIANNYTNADSNVKAECMKCGHIWEVNPTYLFDNPYCPKCHVNKP